MRLILPDLLERFSHIHTQTDRGWVHLPEWAKFFLEVGVSLAHFQNERTRYVAALALPTRSFATPFICSGLSCANIFLHPDINQQHIEFLLSLPEGISVKYLDNGKLKKAITKGVVRNKDKTYIGLLVEGDSNTIKYVSVENAHKIDISGRDYAKLPMHQKGRAIRPPSELLQELLIDKTDEYIFQTRIDGIVVGSMSSLQHDSELQLAFNQKGSKDPEHLGYLSDLFRVIGLNPPSTGHRFMLQSATKTEMAVPVEGLAHHASIIFDGALGFLKWKDAFPRQNWIIVLDRTESGFENAVGRVNEEYIYRSDLETKLPLPNIPSGIEMMFFSRDI